MDEPPVRLRAALKKNGIRETDFSVMNHGEVLSFKSAHRADEISEIIHL